MIHQLVVNLEDVPIVEDQTMGKAKQKTHKESEFLLQQVRHYKKEIKRANQRIKQLEKDLGYTQNKTEKTKKEEDLLPNCEQCGKGFLKEIIVVNRKFNVCSLCAYRSKAVKI